MKSVKTVEIDTEGGKGEEGNGETEIEDDGGFFRSRCWVGVVEEMQGEGYVERGVGCVGEEI